MNFFVSEISRNDVSEARLLVEQNGLLFDDVFDVIYGIYENDTLVGTGARSGNILKMLAIDPAHQGGSILGDLVTALVNSGLEAGFSSLFLYTKAEYATTFQALNFNLLANQGKVILLEYGRGLSHWLESNRALVHSGQNGAVVVNCNPFTNGHRYLIETAAQRVDNLYVFVIREDRSFFPFDVRFKLVKEGVEDLPNVHVLDTSHYIVSDATFPTYFLKKEDSVSKIQMEIDITLFASKIAPFFSITQRFVGTEPDCRLTNSYNEIMKYLLPIYGIELYVIARRETSSGVISASKVRKLLNDRNQNVLSHSSEISKYVPETTIRFLLSDEGLSLIEMKKQKAL